MTDMLLKGLTVYQDVVKEYKNEFVQVWSEQIIHSTLRHRMIISETKGLYNSLARGESCLFTLS